MFNEKIYTCRTSGHIHVLGHHDKNDTKTTELIVKAAVLQMLKEIKNKNNIKINGKYWSSYVQWRNLLLLTPNSVDKSLIKHRFSLHNLLRY